MIIAVTGSSSFGNIGSQSAGLVDVASPHQVPFTAIRVQDVRVWLDYGLACVIGIHVHVW